MWSVLVPQYHMKAENLADDDGPRARVGCSDWKASDADLSGTGELPEILELGIFAHSIGVSALLHRKGLTQHATISSTYLILEWESKLKESRNCVRLI
jgi:hypothetical protein